MPLLWRMKVICIVKEAITILKGFGIALEVHVMSAHCSLVLNDAKVKDYVELLTMRY